MRELRTELFTNWEFGVLPSAEIVDSFDGPPEVIYHALDGSAIRVSWTEFTELAKASARECKSG